ncbi:hypothetical protein MY11210_001013 [Beauveria gryllotalpidicola]
MTTTTANVDTLESPVDLLGGLTGVMPHFYVDRTESAATPTTTVPAVDPLTVLSEAIRKAIASGESSRKEANVHETDSEARSNQDIQDSIVWMGQPSLFSILSDIVVQVCVVDSGAAARLIDAILSVFPVDSMDITSVIPTVAEYSSVSAEDILPLILPAIAAAIGKQVQPSRIANTQNTDGIMANIILRGGLFVGEIINSKVFLASTELYEVLNQVAGLMCTAADHLTLPICTLSKQISGTTYQIVIPCDCTGSPSPSQPPQGYIPKETTSAVDWSVVTIFPTAGNGRYVGAFKSSLRPAPDKLYINSASCLFKCTRRPLQLCTQSLTRLLKLQSVRFAHVPALQTRRTLLVQPAMAL